jgi:hypothetical protein
MPNSTLIKKKQCGQVRKGTRWMPWQLEPMKDVVSNEKSRSGAYSRSREYPNGATLHGKTMELPYEYIVRVEASR